MSSLVERLRIRSEKRPLYKDGGSDDEDFVLSKKKGYSKPEEKPDKRISRDDMVNPLNEIDKILDYEIPATAQVEKDLSAPGDKKNGVKHFLVKWKGLSYLHCTWVPEEEFKKACKVNSRLKGRLNAFQKQLDSMGGTDDDWIAIRPEWTAVDRIIGSRSKEGCDEGPSTKERTHFTCGLK